MRITDRTLERVVEQINSIAFPIVEGSLVQLDRTFSGVKAVYMNGTDIAGTGYVTKRQCYFVLVAFKQGLLVGELR